MVEPWDISQQLRHRRRVLPFRRATVRVEMGLLDVRWISSKINFPFLCTHLKIPLQNDHHRNPKVKDGGNVRGSCRKFRAENRIGQWEFRDREIQPIESRMQFSTQLTRTITSPCEMLKSTRNQRVSRVFYSNRFLNYSVVLRLIFFYFPFRLGNETRCWTRLLYTYIFSCLCSTGFSLPKKLLKHCNSVK